MVSVSCLKCCIAISMCSLSEDIFEDYIPKSWLYRNATHLLVTVKLMLALQLLNNSEIVLVRGSKFPRNNQDLYKPTCISLL
ncbi:hypothetical protein RDI58_014080 [Solanum bulbocastanum]|uniref:Uncharacterized protein n=1 Tax=Solanum bulbocastanum TaxID=147425 RepID=A0AAN8TM56_SOLBU